MTDNQQYSLPLAPPGEGPVQMLGPHEAFARADSKLIDRLIENSVMEKKNGRVKATVLAEYFSMWANTGPHGGLLIVGVENDGQKTGLVSLHPSQVAEIELAGPNLCPDARFEQKRINIFNSSGKPDFVILFFVKFSEKRVVGTHRQEAFIRRGDQKHKLTDFEKAELRIDRGEIDFEDEFSQLSYPSEFDLSAVSRFASVVKGRTPGLSERTDEEILQYRRLGKPHDGNFRANNAAALLFAKDSLERFPGCKVRFIQFDGDVEGTGAKYNGVKDIWIEGTIPQIIDQARSVIRNQIRDYVRLGADGRFFRGPEYPEEAWFEAVVNACVHRSYNMRNRTVFVKMFASRLEIISPGGFPPGVTPENIYNQSNPRNRRVAEALFFFDYVLCSNEGTRRMRDTMAQSNLPEPKFLQSEIDGVTFKVVLENNIAFRKEYVDDRAVQIVGVEQFSSLNEKERMLVNYVAEHQTITVSDAARIVRGGWKQMKKLLDGLCYRNVMERKSPMGTDRDPKAHYRLRPANDQGPREGQNVKAIQR